MSAQDLSEGFISLPRRLALPVLGSIALGFAAQASSFVWYASKIDSRVSSLEEADTRILGRGDTRYADVKARLDFLERDRDRITKLETKVDYIGDGVKRIEDKLDGRKR